MALKSTKPHYNNGKPTHHKLQEWQKTRATANRSCSGKNLNRKKHLWHYKEVSRVALAAKLNGDFQDQILIEVMKKIDYDVVHLHADMAYLFQLHLAATTATHGTALALETLSGWIASAAVKTNPVLFAIGEAVAVVLAGAGAIAESFAPLDIGDDYKSIMLATQQYRPPFNDNGTN